MRAFVTGATGFIGAHLARKLSERGDQVVALVRSPEKAEALRAQGAELVEGDLSDTDAIRRGTDVLTALALGARAVMIGRPVIWGLCDGGADGVARVLTGLRDDLALAMALAGTPTVADVTRDLVA
jgi:4-hydroxymandelate oxidase